MMIKQAKKLLYIAVAGGAVLALASCDGNPAAGTGNSVKDAVASGKEIVMYKSPTCECCGKWAEHLRQAGFRVIEKKRENMDIIKVKYGVPEKLASCHTAIVDGYVIEGHVPAADVERLLKERLQVAGLTAPGMPMKSPGMQEVGQKPQGYDVLSFDKNGTYRVFSKY